MRRFLSLFLIIISIFVLSGCKNKKKINEEIYNDDNFIINESLVLYFSATGTTEKIAKKIKQITNSDIIEIIPKNKYTQDDLNYNSDCRANREQNDSTARPEISNQINIEKYNIIYLGYPIWWGTNPKIILTLLDNINFDGKKIVLFCTSGGSGIDQSIKDLTKYNKNINILDGKRFNSNETDEEIKNWIKMLPIDHS